jgi:hypothetical protein
VSTDPVRIRDLAPDGRMVGRVVYVDRPAKPTLDEAIDRLVEELPAGHHAAARRAVDDLLAVLAATPVVTARMRDAAVAASRRLERLPRWLQPEGDAEWRTAVAQEQRLLYQLDRVTQALGEIGKLRRALEREAR